jgi:thiaminase/transcriptional activator TenA
MIRFSDLAWESTASLRKAIHELPFNTELTTGSLSRDRFQSYILQDAIYRANSLAPLQSRQPRRPIR